MLTLFRLINLINTRNRKRSTLPATQTKLIYTKTIPREFPHHFLPSGPFTANMLKRIAHTHTRLLKYSLGKPSFALHADLDNVHRPRFSPKTPRFPLLSPRLRDAQPQLVGRPRGREKSCGPLRRLLLPPGPRSHFARGTSCGLRRGGGHCCGTGDACALGPPTTTVP